MTRRSARPWFACLIAVASVAGCEAEPQTWVDQCVADTRASREFCECLNERRVVDGGEVRIGSKPNLRLPVLREIELRDQRACRAQIIERINREAFR